MVKDFLPVHLEWTYRARRFDEVPSSGPRNSKVGRPFDGLGEPDHVGPRDFHKPRGRCGMLAVARPGQRDVGAVKPVADALPDEMSLAQRAQEPADGGLGKPGTLMQLMQRTGRSACESFQDRQCAVERAVFELGRHGADAPEGSGPACHCSARLVHGALPVVGSRGSFALMENRDDPAPGRIDDASPYAAAVDLGGAGIRRRCRARPAERRFLRSARRSRSSSARQWAASMVFMPNSLRNTSEDSFPGKPTVIVQSMPGGGGMNALNYVANVALRDGTVLSVPHLNIVQDGSAESEDAVRSRKVPMDRTLARTISRSASRRASRRRGRWRMQNKAKLVAGGVGANNPTALNPRILNVLGRHEIQDRDGLQGDARDLNRLGARRSGCGAGVPARRSRGARRESGARRS